MDKLTAIRYFCAAAESLNFRETANRFAISPSVISRVIHELEAELGEPLFKRTTRSISLTLYGEQFLAQARPWLADSEQLFRPARINEMAGTVRITVPDWRENEAILSQLLTAIEPWPALNIDWRAGMDRLDFVEHRIDIGLRIGPEPDPQFIIRRIADIRDMLVASPALIDKLGAPTDLDDLCRRYPFAAQINLATGHPWPFYLNTDITLVPRWINFLSDDAYGILHAILQGRCVGLASDFVCRPHIETGKLVPLFPEVPIQSWQLYLYRPWQKSTPARVVKVFDLLTQVLKAQFG